MSNNNAYHDLNGQLASLAEGIRLLQENKNEEFKRTIIKLMEKKCADLKETLKHLSQLVTHE